MVRIKRVILYVNKIILVGIILLLPIFSIIGIVSLNFNSDLAPIKGPHELPALPLKDPPEGNTLLLVHGYGLSAKIHYEDTYTDPYIISFYNSVVPIDYYGDVPSSAQTYSLGRSDFDFDTPIEDIALELKNFILNPNNSALFYETIDVIGYSIGGLIIRYLIMNYYEEIKVANLTFENVLLIATPNHGAYHLNGLTNINVILFAVLGVLFCLVLLFSDEEKKMLRLVSILLCFIAMIFVNIILGSRILSVQAYQIQFGSDFLQNLNTGDETPYSVDDSPPYNDINWSTFRGQGGGDFVLERLLLFFSFINEPNDGMINVNSVPLGDGAINYGPYDRNHDEMVMFDTSIEEDRLYFNDIFYVLTGQSYPP